MHPTRDLVHARNQRGETKADRGATGSPAPTMLHISAASMVATRRSSGRCTDFEASIMLDTRSRTSWGWWRRKDVNVTGDPQGVWEGETEGEDMAVP